MIWTGLSRYSSFGLLVMRVGLGIAFIMHGLGKFQGGEEARTAVLTAVGSAMGNLGISGGHYYFGFAAAGAECLGGLLVLLGALFQPACLLLVWVLAVALFMHISKGDGFSGYSHALELLVVFFGLLFVGPGRYSIDGEGIRKASRKP